MDQMSYAKTRVPAAAVAAVLAFLLVSLAAPPAHAGRAEDYARAAVKATNAARLQHGVRPLGSGDCLQRFAARQAAVMAARRQIFHQDLGPVLRGCGLRMAGENVAAGFASGRGVVRNGWMRSAGHRHNILDSRFQTVRVAARRGANGVWYVAQVFGRR